MTIGPFTVGERPSEPLLVTVTDSDGTPLDLTEYDDVDIEGLPTGVTTVADAPNGQVQYTFTTAFADPGLVSFRVRMAQTDGDVDYSPWAEIEVHGAPVARCSPTQAFAYTAQQVSATDLFRAQVQVALVVDRDLADDDVWSGIVSRDQALLKQAIAWQAVELTKVEAAGLGSVPGAVTGLSTAGQSISFAAGTTLASSTSLTPVVTKVLNRISWRVRQVSSHLEADARGPMPDPWVRQVDYVVGHNFGLYVGTL